MKLSQIIDTLRRGCQNDPDLSWLPSGSLLTYMGDDYDILIPMGDGSFTLINATVKTNYVSNVETETVTPSESGEFLTAEGLEYNIHDFFSY